MARKKVKFELNPLLSGPSLETRERLGSPYRELPLDNIDVDPDQPRRVFETESLAELAASISEYGVLCPILVRVAEGGVFRLIAGERRLRAAKMAGLTTIPAVIDSGEEAEITTLAKQLVENVQRQDLTPMERALAVGQLKETYQWSVREIAKRLGVSKSFVQRSFDILSLPDDLQAALIAGAAESKVLLLSQVKNRASRKELLEQIDELTRAQLETLIKGEKAPSSKVSHGGTAGTKKTPSAQPTAEDQRIIREIQRSLGTKVQISRKAGNAGQGKLTIEFYSPEDLDDIYHRLARSRRKAA